MRREQKIIFIFFIFSSILFSFPEEAYIEIEMKKHKNEFYRVLLDEETQNIYLGIGEFIDFSKISDLKFDPSKLRIKGKLDDNIDIDIKVSEENIIKKDEDIFITLEDLKKYFRIKDYVWDEERYALNLNPEFKTQKEQQEELNAQRSLLALSKKEKENVDSDEIIKAKKKWISPGILKIAYENDDFENNNYSFDIDYGTELFYGEFQISQKIYPENNLDYIRLQYPGVLGSYFLSFGDFYLENDNIFEIERTLRGISFSKNEYYGIRVNNTTIIEGLAYNSNLVELYRNGFLTDFQLMTSDNFIFNVDNVSSTDKYTVKIFYRDGRSETKDIYILGNQNLMNRGENDFVLQGGQGINQKNMQYLGKYSYGLTKDMTISLGLSFLENEDGEKYNVLESGITYRFGFEEYPTLISGTILQEINDNELNFKGVIEQKLLWNSNLIFRYETYGDKTSERLRSEEIYNFEINKNSRRWSTSLGYTKDIYKDDSYNSIYLNLDYTIIKNVRLSLNNEYYKDYTPNSSVKKLEGYGTGARVSFSSLNGMIMILDGKINYEENRRTEDEIKIGIAKTPSNSGIFKNIDTALEIGYSDEKGKFFEVRFTYIFDNNIYIELPNIKIEDRKTRIGGKLEKSFYVGNPKLPINNNNVMNGWVEGKVYIDENGNGIMDEKEVTYEGAQVISSGGESRVDNSGSYIIGNISNRDIHKLEVNRESIDPMLIQAKENLKFKGATSSSVKVDIPLAPVSMISGFVEKSEEIEDRKYSGVLAGVEIVLKENSKEIKRTQPEIDGYYFFEDILPGNYTIELISTSKRYKGSFNVENIKVNIKSSREGNYYEDNNFFIKYVELVQDKILDEEEK